MKIRFDYHEQNPKMNELPKKDDQTIVNLGSINNKLNPPGLGAMHDMLDGIVLFGAKAKSDIKGWGNSRVGLLEENLE